MCSTYINGLIEYFYNQWNTIRLANKRILRLSKNQVKHMKVAQLYVQPELTI